MKVLIVSNKEHERTWVRNALGPGWTFREASDGLQARRRAQTGGFDLVIAYETAIPYGAFGLTREVKILPDPPAVLILLEPPSLEELERRLRSRGTEDEGRLADRLAKAEWELGQRDLFDHVVVNRVAERAADEVHARLHRREGGRIPGVVLAQEDGVPSRGPGGVDGDAARKVRKTQDRDVGVRTGWNQAAENLFATKTIRHFPRA